MEISKKAENAQNKKSWVSNDFYGLYQNKKNGIVWKLKQKAQMVSRGKNYKDNLNISYVQVGERTIWF